jgi:hypothetical protein
MSIPKEPRQMMINMMYLVLTALLALNVSAEILNAFHTVNQGIINSNVSVDNKNAITMKSFAGAMDKDAAKTKPWMDKANTVESEAEKMNKEIDAIKDEIVEQTGGWKDEAGNKGTGSWSPEKGRLEDEKNLDVSTRLMVEEKKGYELQDKLLALRNKYLSLIDDPATKKTIEAQMPLNIPAKDAMFKNSEGQQKDWVDLNFHMVPTIACVTLLNKYKNDVKNSEAMLMDYFLAQINAKDFKFDKLTARVIAPTSYVMSGQEYKSDIFVAAFNSTSNPEVIIGPLNANAKRDPSTNEFIETNVNPVSGGKTIDVKGGMGRYAVVAGGEGEQTYTGAVKIAGPTGDIYYPFEAKYTSAKGSAVISSDNLNIIYAGVPNPFTVSVPGFPADKVVATATGGSFSGSKGKYTASMPASMIGKEITINVSVQQDGATKQIGSQVYKVKRIPDPVAKVAGRFEGDINSGEAKAAPGVNATLQDFYFAGVTFTVSSYDFIYIAKRQDPYLKQVGGWQFSGDVKTKLAAAKPGDQVIIRNIKAKGPDGTVRSLNPVTLTLK